MHRPLSSIYARPVREEPAPQRIPGRGPDATTWRPAEGGAAAVFGAHSPAHRSAAPQGGRPRVVAGGIIPGTSAADGAPSPGASARPGAAVYRTESQRGPAPLPTSGVFADAVTDALRPVAVGDPHASPSRRGVEDRVLHEPRFSPGRGHVQHVPPPAPAEPAPVAAAGRAASPAKRRLQAAMKATMAANRMARDGARGRQYADWQERVAAADLGVEVESDGSSGDDVVAVPLTATMDGAIPREVATAVSVAAQLPPSAAAADDTADDVRPHDRFLRTVNAARAAGGLLKHSLLRRRVPAGLRGGLSDDGDVPWPFDASAPIVLALLMQRGADPRRLPAHRPLVAEFMTPALLDALRPLRSGTVVAHYNPPPPGAVDVGSRESRCPAERHTSIGTMGIAGGTAAVLLVRKTAAPTSAVVERVPLAHLVGVSRDATRVSRTFARFGLRGPVGALEGDGYHVVKQNGDPATGLAPDPADYIRGPVWASSAKPTAVPRRNALTLWFATTAGCRCLDVALYQAAAAARWAEVLEAFVEVNDVDVTRAPWAVAPPPTVSRTEVLHQRAMRHLEPPAGPAPQPPSDTTGTASDAVWRDAPAPAAGRFSAPVPESPREQTRRQQLSQITRPLDDGVVEAHDPRLQRLQEVARERDAMAAAEASQAAPAPPPPAPPALPTRASAPVRASVPALTPGPAAVSAPAAAPAASPGPGREGSAATDVVPALPLQAALSPAAGDDAPPAAAADLPVGPAVPGDAARSASEDTDL